ncbi:glycoside hydrolase [Serendipita vermifera]|nr:glycoside hydrolase [Serendipita vermifera]
MERSADVNYHSVPQEERGTSTPDHVVAINNNGDYPFTAPSPQFLSQNSTTNFRSSEYGSMAPLRNDASSAANEMGTRGDATVMNEKSAPYEAPRAKTKRKGMFWALVALVLVIIIVAIIVPVYFFVIKKKDSDDNNTSSGNHHGSNTNTHESSPSPTPTVTTWGGDGSIVTKEDGTTFIYNNTFGGYWVYDPANPLNNSARAQDYTPPLSERWRWGRDIMYGVNLGGWLNLEPFISPAMYEPFYPNAVDEWTLSEQIQARDGNLDAIEEHYKTFIVEEDFAMIAAAGLNWVRLPIPFWIIETYPGEPFLARTGWTYFLKAIEWARKYGLRINLDLHAVPGSQNGWNHSGKLGPINFLSGVMGVANAQRTLDYIRILAEFISQPEYSPIIPFFGIINEPSDIPETAIKQFYAEAYRVIRRASGLGDGNGPMISLHDDFLGMSRFYGFLDGADRLALDSHQYLIFGGVSGAPVGTFAARACSEWSAMFGDPMNVFGLTASGEWSYAINDCGLYINRVGSGSRYDGTFAGHPRVGDCAADGWLDYRTWDASIKDGLRNLALASMDALGNSFFWTWRIGESLETGRVMAPFWSYKLAVQEGWAVPDPRTSNGYCASIGQIGNTFTGTLSANQVGGPGAGTSIPDLDTWAWPPTVVAGFDNAAALPTYTPTGPLITMPVPTATQGANIDFGTGWNNPEDTEPMHVPVPGCAYPNAWDAVSAAPVVC